SGRRSDAWLKVKPTRTADFVVGGDTKGEGARAPLGALLVGAGEEGKLRDASHVGPGLDDRTPSLGQKKLQPLERKTCPFSEKPDLPTPTTWVEPRLVVEVKYHSWTEDDHLRAPVFLRLRDDLDPKKVRRPRAVPTTAVTASGREATAPAGSKS